MSAPSNQPVSPDVPATEIPNPTLFWETINAYQRTAALRAGLELEIFTAIARGVDTPQTIAERCRASERGVRILCDYLVVIGFLLKPSGRYTLTRESAAFLDIESPTYLGGMRHFIDSPHTMPGFQNFTEVVRRGTTLLEGAGIVDPDDPAWVEFAACMTPQVAWPSEFIADLLAREMPGPLRVLDLAAGHGLFGIKIARRHPGTEIIAQDWAKVLEVAQGNARAAGISPDRYRLLPGDAFQVEFPKECDVVLITNLFHHFDLPTCRLLVDKIHACLKPGGRALTFDFVPNEDRVSPPVAAAFGLVMLGLTPAGDVYTFRQYEELFRGAGFQRSELVPVPGSAEDLIVSFR